MGATKVAAVSFALAVLLAGCMNPGGDDVPATSTPSGPPSPNSCADYDPPTFVTDGGFSGPNAFGHLLRIVCDFTKDPPVEQSRVPGTPGRIASAHYLHSALEAAGWSASYENFTGAQYQALDKGNVTAYASASQGSSCKAADEERVRTLEFSNVMAEHGTGSKTLILMAHYDSKRFATKETDPKDRTRPVLGANDGASGVALLVEVARVLASDPLDLRLRILLVDGEDGFEDCHPLAGSVFHAQRMDEADRKKIEGVLLLDMVGDAAAKFCLSYNNASLAERLKTAATDQNVPGVSEAPPCGVLDDHTAFMDVGVAAVDVIDFYRTDTRFPPYWHTLDDTPDKIDAAMLDQVGRTVAAFVRGFNA